MDDQILLPEILNRIVASLAPDQVLLFGSSVPPVKGSPGDIDLLLVGRWTLEPADLMRHGRRLVMNLFPRVDLVFCHPDDIVEPQLGRNTFLASIIDKAVVLYRR